MKLFLQNIITIIIAFTLLFVTSMVLDLIWVKQQPVRQILVYLLMLIEIYPIVNFLILINKKI